MSRAKIISSVVCLVVAISLGIAAAKPNFSGTWVMDKNGSFGIPPDMEQTMTVTQADDKITVDIKIVTSRGERMINDVYTLDGKEAEFTPQGPSGPSGKGKRSVKWLPNGNGIVVSEETTTDSPNGPVTTQQLRKWTLSADGTRLIIDFHTDSPRGNFESKRVFVKK